MLYREMRRKDREICERGKIEAILDRALICHLGLCYDNWPYVIPLNYGYEDGHLYFHGANEGKKIDIIKENPKACFQVENDVTLIPRPDKRSGFDQSYRSVIGFGNIRIVEDFEEKRHALKVLAAHYCRQGVDIPRPDKLLEKVCVIDLEIIHMTGKERGPFIER